MPEEVTDVIFEAFFALVAEEGMPAVRKRAGIPSSTTDRWQTARMEGKRPGLNRASLEALLSLDEVRSAAASCLLSRADEDATAWESIGAALSDLMSPAAGWVLVRKLREMDDLRILDSQFALLEGAIEAARNSDRESQRAKSLKSKEKQKIS